MAKDKMKAHFSIQNPYIGWIAPFAFCLLLPCSLQAQTKSSHDNDKSIRTFVQHFYDWYAPIAGKHDFRYAWTLLLKHKKTMFSPQLIESLGNDYEAQNKTEAGGEITGIDFDPFLASQDPADHYVVGNITL